ncbi:hypothetical protein FACS1894191_5690 [Clostridia bacterium]|nr:hypothetical protein FACS1894191_5690 [Clostridia bacterium]
MDSARYYVEVTSELQSAAYKILTEHEPRLRPDMEADESRDCDWINSVIHFGIDASDDGMYPNGTQLAFATFVQLGPNDALAPSTTLLALTNLETAEPENYLYPSDVYDKLLALFSANIKESHANLEGEFIRLRHEPPEMYDSSGEEITYWPNGDMFECGNFLVYSRFAGEEGAPHKYWQIQFFDLGTEKASSIMEYQGDDDSLGSLLRIEKLNGIPGFDSAMYYEKGYVYKNSGKLDEALQFALPEGVKPVQKSGRRATDYDEYGDSIAWVGDDGIYLSAKQGGVGRLVLPDAKLSELYPRSDYPDGLVYVMPRFICGGTKLASMVYPPLYYDDVGVVIYDIASDKISSLLQYYPPATAQYPITDRYVATRGFTSNLQILDAETGGSTKLTSAWVGYSYDYKTMIVLDVNTLDANNVPAYVCDVGNVTDRSKPLLRTRNPHVSVNFMAVTENCAIFSVSDAEGDWLAVARYRDA